MKNFEVAANDPEEFCDCCGRLLGECVCEPDDDWPAKPLESK